MASSHETISMAVFCDFENVAIGVRDAKYEKFDINRVLERLLLKGSIVIKKAYCDWDRYKAYKQIMHEANFELIEIPHVRQSGKNSADIRLVVDALDLCYTKSHIDTFVIISGDSDFSPLVSKLRENDKQVIGVGVKQSTSDLLTANCDEFIFYDDLVRESERESRRKTQEKQAAPRHPSAQEASGRDEQETRKSRAIALVVETFDALMSERGDSGKIWASALKQAVKRRKPDFNESYYGFRAFGNLLEEASARGLLETGRDEKSGTYVYRSNGGEKAAGEAGRSGPASVAALIPPAANAEPAQTAPVPASVPGAGPADGQQPAQRRKRPGARVPAPAAPSAEKPMEKEKATEKPAEKAAEKTTSPATQTDGATGPTVAQDAAGPSPQPGTGAEAEAEAEAEARAKPATRRARGTRPRKQQPKTAEDDA